jgi:hypothetical protein
MVPGYEEFEATSLFCARLVLPTGAKYDYLCAACGSPVGGKLDDDPSEFRRTAPPAGMGGTGIGRRS